MGKTFELLGLVSFNMFVALMLSITFLSRTEETARVHELTEGAVAAFVKEATAISSGQKVDFDSYEITTYFMEHIADGSQFKTVLRTSSPNAPSDERTVDMDKMTFISNVLQGQKIMQRHEAAVTVEYVKIEEGGKTAQVVITSRERGMMPVPDMTGEEVLMPVEGVSYCEQTMGISSKHKIQMTGASCTTDLVISEGL